ncbi:MAG: glycosyltransferase family 39 protein [Nitrospirota bacterium]|nr:glycosyltransferase family 39 protein [Nitrospirota bacterium]
MLKGTIIPVSVFCFALVLRLVYLFQINSSSPFMESEIGDSAIYIAKALKVIDGDILSGREVFFHSSPLYIYFLAAIFALFGKGFFAVRLIQIVVGSLSCVLLYFIARRYFGQQVAVISGIMAALYGYFIFSDADLLAINLVIFFALSALLAFIEGQARGSFSLICLAGIFLGLSTLGKPDMLLLAPALFFWLFFRMRKRADLPRSRPYILCLVFFLSVSFTVFPVTVRNYMVQKDLVLITSNGGINFYIGNNPDATGMFVIPQDRKLYNDDRFYQSTFTWPQAKTGRSMLPSEVSRFWFREGLEFIKEEPRKAIEILGLKFLLFWNWYEIPNNHDYYYAKVYLSPLLKMPFITGFSVIAPLALLGLFLLLRQKARNAEVPLFPLLVFMLLPMITAIAFFVTGRYRLPAVVFFFPFAGYAISSGFSILKAGLDRRLWLPAGIFFLVAVFTVNIRMPVFNENLGIANEHDDIATLYCKQGEFRKAAEIYERAVTYKHNEALLYYKLGGIYHLKLNELQKAYAAFKKSAELEPQNIDSALSLGVTALQTGRVDEAEREFRKILDLEPGYTKALVNLGVVYTRTGRPAEALPLLQKAVENDPSNFNALTNLGYAYLLVKDFKNAVACEEAALRINYASIIARLDLAEALLGLGNKVRAKEELGIILKNTPEGHPVRQRAESLYRTP